MKKEEALEIAKKFPEKVKIVPRAGFEDQLAEFIVKQNLKKD